MWLLDRLSPPRHDDLVRKHLARLRHDMPVHRQVEVLALQVASLQTDHMNQSTMQVQIRNNKLLRP